VAKCSNTLFEIGVNAGYSIFLARMSNNNLEIFRNDITVSYQENCVPLAVNVLNELFDNSVTFIRGDCLTEVPRFVQENPSIEIDFVHIDGCKETYRQDFFNLMPVLKLGAYVIFDDTNIPTVQNIVNELLTMGYVERIPEFPQMDPAIPFRNEVLRYMGNKNIFSNI
jgi:predicted O-methyltransferase YrrM